MQFLTPDHHRPHLEVLPLKEVLCLSFLPFEIQTSRLFSNKRSRRFPRLRRLEIPKPNRDPGCWDDGNSATKWRILQPSWEKFLGEPTQILLIWINLQQNVGTLG